MDTVFAPCLGQRLEFDVRRFSAELLVVFLNCLHLDKIKKQVFFLAQSNQRLVVKVANRPMHEFKLIWLYVRARRFSFIADYTGFDAVVCEYFFCDCLDLFLRDIAEQDVFSCRSSVFNFYTHIGNRRRYRFRDGVGDAAFKMHLD